jgi:hypothetical protein
MFKSSFLSSRGSYGFVAPVGLIVACGALLALESRRSSTLRADATVYPDMDGDGLVDRQEPVLGTSEGVPDTDGDLYSDTEEFARGSSPIFSESIPHGTGLHAGITARGEADGLHALVAVYLPDSNFRGLDLQVGTLSGSRLIFLPRSILATRGTVDFVAADLPTASIALFDFRFPRSWVDHAGHLTMFATVGRVGTGTVDQVAVMELFNIGGVVVLAAPDPTTIPAIHVAAATSSAGTIYRPLTTGGDDTPRGWAIEQVCFQQSEPVGVNGAIVTNEVTSAECRVGWDGSCPGSCASSVGSTYTSIDPAALIGG